MEKKRFDVAVIGAGPGGYVAAIKAAQNGKSVALIEKGDLGGTCLNVGCIPTKTLLANALVMHKVKMAEQYGIMTGDVTFDFGKMKIRKDQVIEQMRGGINTLMKANKIEVFHGKGEFTSPSELKVVGKDTVILKAENTIIATGSEPLDIPTFPCDHSRILNSTSILELTQLPKSLAIIGGGYIGCEFASLYAEFGVKVTILEALPAILTPQGKVIGEAVSKAFIKKGVEIRTGVMVEGIDHEGNGVRVRLRGGETLDAELALVAIGRKIHSKGLHLEKAGVHTDSKGAISVNDKMETSVPGIYAIGDVTGLFLLAHVASHQGIVAASNICGHEMHMHYNAVPAVIFTNPEIAMIGMTLEEAKEKGYNAQVGKFPFQALGKAVASIETEGFAEIIIENTTGQILGAQVVGHEASALIGEIAIAMQNELTIECISDTIHAHPTLPEVWLEAALVATNTPIHLPPRRR